MKTWSDHPPETLLLDFAASTLPPESSREVGSHVQTCVSCRDYLTTLTGATSPGRLTAAQVERTKISDQFLGREIGEYRILERLGQGGMGVVYRGENRLIGKPVAVKVLLSSVAGDASVAQRMLTEARAVNAVRHPNIVDVFALGQLPDGRPYLVMELLSGRPLTDILRDQHSLSPQRALPLLIEALDALAAAHAVGVVHRDLKPDNLFIDPREDGWRVKLLDFGLAKKHGPQDARLTRPGTLMGTPGYMSPEQVRDSEAVTEKTDVYAMGVVAWTMLAGREPFAGGTAVEVMHRHLSTPAPPLPADAGASPELAALIARMLAKDPDKRPTAAEARTEFEALARAPWKKTVPVVRAPPQSKKRLIASIAVLSLLALVAVSGIVWVEATEEHPEIPRPLPLSQADARALTPSPSPSAPTGQPPPPEPIQPPAHPLPEPASEAIDLPESRVVARVEVSDDRWKCEWVMGVSEVQPDAFDKSILFFELRIDGQRTVLVTDNTKKRTAKKQLQRLRDQVERCRGKAKDLVVARSRNHPSGLWSKDGRLLAGLEVMASDLRVAERPVPVNADADTDAEADTP